MLLAGSRACAYQLERAWVRNGRNDGTFADT